MDVQIQNLFVVKTAIDDTRVIMTQFGDIVTVILVSNSYVDWNDKN